MSARREADRPIYILNHGGGLNSAVVEAILLAYKLPLDLIVFCDLHAEKIRTYAAVSYYRRLAELFGVEFVVIDSEKDRYAKTIYDYYFDKEQIPSRSWRDCSGKFKKYAVRRYLLARYGKKRRFVQYINYAADEAERITDSDVKYIDLRHVLADLGFSRQDCINYLEARGLPIPDKSGCYFCMMQSRQSWFKLKAENPDMAALSIALEERGQRFPKDTLYKGTPLKVMFAQNENDGQTTLDDACGGASGCWT